MFTKKYVLPLLISTIFLSGCASNSETPLATPETVKISSFNAAGMEEVLSKNVPASSHHTVSIPAGWSESIVASNLDFNMIYYSDFILFQETPYPDSDSSLIVPLSNSAAVGIMSLPALNLDGTPYTCSLAREKTRLHGDPRGSECAIPLISESVRDKFINVNSSSDFIERLVTLEDSVYKQRKTEGSPEASVVMEKSRDGNFVLYVVRYSENSYLNYGGVAFTDVDDDGVIRAYNTVRIFKEGSDIQSIEDLKALPEFSILQTLKDTRE